ncbi:LLM class flavin-dependent oxidoreductase, partial [Mycetohabitans sp. B3]|nr:LLM class flavin-dependent oxidoreductase [Mycetohabitans sp. B3]
ERLEYQGKHYTIPLPAGQGTGLGKPLKIINQPVQKRIPILLAALGPKNVELAAEAAEGWQPIFYLPEKAHDVWGQALAAGRAKRDPALGELDVYAGPVLAIGDNVESLREFVKPHLALYIGGMGAKGKNFYHMLATRYGYGAEADRIQQLYLAGDKDGAAK